MLRLLRRTLVLLALLALPAAATAQDDMMRATAPASLQWVDPQVPGFAPGMLLAAIQGDPAVPDKVYTLRLKFPDGYRFPAHFHPKAEHLTVLSGTFLLTMGERESEDLTAYAPGSFLFMPPNKPHYGGARGETVIQLHGVGPFEIKLVNPVRTSSQ